MASSLQNAIQFFQEFGLFDVVLPFLLVFSLVFAVLEKTMILGKESHGGKDIPNKNLNASMAFVIAMLVIASTKIVGIINTALPNIILLLVVSLMFLLLIGIFVGTGELNFSKEHSKANTFILIIMFFGVILVFLDAIPASSGKSWLDFIWDFILTQWSGAVFSSIVILLVIIGAILFVTNTPKPSGGENKKGVD